MCLIVDTNSLHSVFKAGTSDYNNFEPVRNWLYNGKGIILYGGTKYIEELDNYLDIILELKTINKAKYVKSEKVDKEILTVNKLVKDKDFDDQHIVALLRVTKCKLIVSKDKRAHPFFQVLYYFLSQQIDRKYIVMQDIYQF